MNWESIVLAILLFISCVGHVIGHVKANDYRSTIERTRNENHKMLKKLTEIKRYKIVQESVISTHSVKDCDVVARKIGEKLQKKGLIDYEVVDDLDLMNEEGEKYRRLVGTVKVANYEE